MSLRNSPFETSSASRFCLTVNYGRGARSISMPPLLFYLVAGVLPVLALWYLFATVYFIFRDDMLASLMNRQTEMQYAYEGRVSALHAQIDQLNNRRLLDEASLATKMDTLASRQVRLERRSAVVSSLAERVFPASETQHLARQQATAPENENRAKLAATARLSANPLLSGAFSNQLPQDVSAFAPAESVPAAAPQWPGSTKPRPDGFDLRHSEESDDAPSVPEKSSDASGSADSELALKHLTASLDTIERDQDRLVAKLQMPVVGEMARFQTVLAEAGLSVNRLALRDTYSGDERKPRGASSKANESESAIGGPFIPVNLDADSSAFERQAVSLQDAILAVEHLRRAISAVPLRKPLAGDPDITSPFGTRIDPFYGRAAMHTGIDLREDYGADVHATATGKITIASSDGGYGNLIEIDHGNGLATRYAHLSAILVSEGQVVQAGQVIGRIGMTGRTTGPHLHYETRLDGEPVDPFRFLKAGSKLFSEAKL